MSSPVTKPCVIVVSPFLDKKHGTERCIVEWVSRLTDTFDVHVYSQSVEDMDLGQLTWHRIPKLPGPHLLNYLWWFAANHLWRTWDRRFGEGRADVVFTPGINCLDASVTAVFVVFAEYKRKMRDNLRLRGKPVSLWPQLLHRRLYYGLIAFLEGRVYQCQRTTVVLIARRTGVELKRYFGRRDAFPVIYIGHDHDTFNPERRASRREEARNKLGFSSQRFVVLLIGNHWSNKGLPVLLQALELVRDLPIDVLAVGREDPSEYQALVRAKSLDGRVQFALPRPDVDFYYAAADAYAGPSLEDTFALPGAEALACGLPVIVSSANGVSEVITHETNGLILNDPRDAVSLASMLRKLYFDEEFRTRLGANAAANALQYTWERNARQLTSIFEDVLRKKSRTRADALAQKSQESGD